MIRNDFHFSLFGGEMTGSTALLHLLISFLLYTQVDSRGVLSIKLSEFHNPSGRAFDGGCCDASRRTDDVYSVCGDNCDYVMRLIVTGLGRANDHVFLFHRPLKYNSNDVIFQDNENNLVLTVLFDKWPLDDRVKMSAFFYDYDDFDHTTTLVDWFVADLKDDIPHSIDQSAWDINGVYNSQTIIGNRRNNKTKLVFEWSVLCSEGSDCLQRSTSHYSSSTSSIRPLFDQFQEINYGHDETYNNRPLSHLKDNRYKYNYNKDLYNKGQFSKSDTTKKWNGMKYVFTHRPKGISPFSKPIQNRFYEGKTINRNLPTSPEQTNAKKYNTFNYRGTAQMTGEESDKKISDEMVHRALDKHEVFKEEKHQYKNKGKNVFSASAAGTPSTFVVFQKDEDFIMRPTSKLPQYSTHLTSLNPEEDKKQRPLHNNIKYSDDEDSHQPYSTTQKTVIASNRGHDDYYLSQTLNSNERDSKRLELSGKAFNLNSDINIKNAFDKEAIKKASEFDFESSTSKNLEHSHTYSSNTGKTEVLEQSRSGVTSSLDNNPRNTAIEHQNLKSEYTSWSKNDVSTVSPSQLSMETTPNNLEEMEKEKEPNDLEHETHQKTLSEMIFGDGLLSNEIDENKNNVIFPIPTSTYEPPIWSKNNKQTTKDHNIPKTNSVKSNPYSNSLPKLTTTSGGDLDFKMTSSKKELSWLSNKPELAEEGNTKETLWTKEDMKVTENIKYTPWLTEDTKPVSYTVKEKWWAKNLPKSSRNGKYSSWLKSRNITNNLLLNGAPKLMDKRKFLSQLRKKMKAMHEQKVIRWSSPITNPTVKQEVTQNQFLGGFNNDIMTSNAWSSSHLEEKHTTLKEALLSERNDKSVSSVSDNEINQNEEKLTTGGHNNQPQNVMTSDQAKLEQNPETTSKLFTPPAVHLCTTTEITSNPEPSESTSSKSTTISEKDKTIHSQVRIDQTSDKPENMNDSTFTSKPPGVDSTSLIDNSEEYERRKTFWRSKLPNDIEILSHSIKKLKSVKFLTAAPVKWFVTGHPAFSRHRQKFPQPVENYKKDDRFTFVSGTTNDLPINEISSKNTEIHDTIKIIKSQKETTGTTLSPTPLERFKNRFITHPRKILFTSTTPTILEIHHSVDDNKHEFADNREVVDNRDEFINSREKFVDNRDEFINNREKFVDNREVDNRNEFINNRENFVDNRDEFVDNRKKIVDNRNEFADNREVVDNRNELVGNRDEFVDNRDEFVDNRDEFVDNRDEFVDNREVVDNRDEFVDNREVVDNRDEFVDNRKVVVNRDGFVDNNRKTETKDRYRNPSTYHATKMNTPSARYIEIGKGSSQRVDSGSYNSNQVKIIKQVESTDDRYVPDTPSLTKKQTDLISAAAAIEGPKQDTTGKKTTKIDYVEKSLTDEGSSTRMKFLGKDFTDKKEPFTPIPITYQKHEPVEKLLGSEFLTTYKHLEKYDTKPYQSILVATNPQTVTLDHIVTGSTINKVGHSEQTTKGGLALDLTTSHSSGQKNVFDNNQTPFEIKGLTTLPSTAPYVSEFIKNQEIIEKIDNNYYSPPELKQVMHDDVRSKDKMDLDDNTKIAQTYEIAHMTTATKSTKTPTSQVNMENDDTWKIYNENMSTESRIFRSTGMPLVSSNIGSEYPSGSSDLSKIVLTSPKFYTAKYKENEIISNESETKKSNQDIKLKEESNNSDKDLNTSPIIQETLLTTTPPASSKPTRTTEAQTPQTSKDFVHTSDILSRLQTSSSKTDVSTRDWLEPKKRQMTLSDVIHRLSYLGFPYANDLNKNKHEAKPLKNVTESQNTKNFVIDPMNSTSKNPSFGNSLNIDGLKDKAFKQRDEIQFGTTISGLTHTENSKKSSNHNSDLFQSTSSATIIASNNLNIQDKDKSEKKEMLIKDVIMEHDKDRERVKENRFVKVTFENDQLKNKFESTSDPHKSDDSYLETTFVSSTNVESSPSTLGFEEESEERGHGDLNDSKTTNVTLHVLDVYRIMNSSFGNDSFANITSNGIAVNSSSNQTINVESVMSQLTNHFKQFFSLIAERLSPFRNIFKKFPNNITEQENVSAIMVTTTTDTTQEIIAESTTVSLNTNTPTVGNTPQDPLFHTNLIDATTHQPLPSMDTYSANTHITKSTMPSIQTDNHMKTSRHIYSKRKPPFVPGSFSLYEVDYTSKTFHPYVHVKNTMRTLPENGFVLHTQLPPKKVDRDTLILPVPKLERTSRVKHVQKLLPSEVDLHKFRNYLMQIRHGPKVEVPAMGLYKKRKMPKPDTQARSSSSEDIPRLVRNTRTRRPISVSLQTVFTRYWPAVLGICIGTVFLLSALITSVLCRQRRLWIQRGRWTDSPQHLSEPPDTSEYATSSAASLTSDLARSSTHLM